MDEPAQHKPADVPDGAMQAGEIPARWAWIEGSAWTPRMVAALEHGVKGGNAYLAAHGLFSMTTAHAALRHSSMR
jgi:hypothetical protein